MTKKLPEPYESIVNEIAPDVLREFVRKSHDYGDSWRLLGAKGQFSDINRKFWKLYNSIWMGRDLVGEQPAECARDIIGHCLLLLYILERESTPERPLFSSHESDVRGVFPACDPVGYTEDPTPVEQSDTEA